MTEFLLAIRVLGATLTGIAGTVFAVERLSDHIEGTLGWVVLLGACAGACAVLMHGCLVGWRLLRRVETGLGHIELIPKVVERLEAGERRFEELEKHVGLHQGRDDSA